MTEDIVERVRSFEADHVPEGWPAIRMREVSALADEIERLRGELATMTERHEQVCIGAKEELRKRWDAESGYNTIAERLYSSPVALMDTRAALFICALREEDFPVLYALKGKRVRLVVEDQE